MDYAVNWSPEALEDIDSIAEYITRDSLFYAKAVVSKMLAVARTLPQAPKIGRIVPEVGKPDVRERFVYSYRLVYQIREKDILILAVIHGKRLLEGVSDRFE